MLLFDVELGVPLPLNLVYPAGAKELRVERYLVTPSYILTFSFSSISQRLHEHAH
jgi:hypothetical protein